MIGLYNSCSRSCAGWTDQSWTKVHDWHLCRLVSWARGWLGWWVGYKQVFRQMHVCLLCWLDQWCIVKISDHSNEGWYYSKALEQCSWLPFSWQANEDGDLWIGPMMSNWMSICLGWHESVSHVINWLNTVSPIEYMHVCSRLNQWVVGQTTSSDQLNKWGIELIQVWVILERQCWVDLWIVWCTFVPSLIKST